MSEISLNFASYISSTRYSINGNKEGACVALCVELEAQVAPVGSCQPQGHFASVCPGSSQMKTSPCPMKLD